MDEPQMKIIDVFICKLRKKLQVAGAGHLIGTVRGRGFILRDEDNRAPMLPGAPAMIGALAGMMPARWHSVLPRHSRLEPNRELFDHDLGHSGFCEHPGPHDSMPSTSPRAINGDCA
jgi:hypothetical protein